MEYEKGYVYKLMDQGGPTDNREHYFQEAVEEMMRARTLCTKANATLPDDPSYVSYLEELFDRKLDDVRILTPFICDFGNRVKFGKGVFINHSAILSASGRIEFEDGVMSAPGLRIATINHDMNQRHTIYTYGKVLVKKNAWLGMNVTICPGVTIGEYAVWRREPSSQRTSPIMPSSAACPRRSSAVRTHRNKRNDYGRERTDPRTVSEILAIHDR